MLCSTKARHAAGQLVRHVARCQMDTYIESLEETLDVVDYLLNIARLIPSHLATNQVPNTRENQLQLFKKVVEKRLLRKFGLLLHPDKAKSGA